MNDMHVFLTASTLAYTWFTPKRVRCDWIDWDLILKSLHGFSEELLCESSQKWALCLVSFVSLVPPNPVTSQSFQRAPQILVRVYLPRNLALSRYKMNVIWTWICTCYSYWFHCVWITSKACFCGHSVHRLHITEMKKSLVTELLIEIWVVVTSLTKLSLESNLGLFQDALTLSGH